MQLHQYQIDARNWILSNPYSGLFLPPGLGKTLITLDTIDLLLRAKVIDKILIIAPLRVAHIVWPQEIIKWGFPMSITVLHGPDKDILVRKKCDIQIINPEGLKWLLTNYINLFSQNRCMLICDESTLFKNHGSKRFSRLRKVLDLFDRRVILTGTPAPNGLLQLWSQIYILDRGKRLGSGITKYRTKWFTPDFLGFSYDIKEGADEEIYAAIDDIVMHKANDELNLPELINNTIFIELPYNARKLYKEMKDEFMIELEELDVIAINAAAKAAKLKQIANGVLYGDDKIVIHIHDEKLKACDELANSLAGRPLMIVYEYLHDLARLKHKYNAPHIGSGVSGNKLNDIIVKWNNGEIPILLVQPQAGGHGLNLQDGGCCDVLHYSITFDLELYEQVNARVHRQGVKNSVTIHHIVAMSTVDTKVMKALIEKSEVQTALLESLRK